MVTGGAVASDDSSTLLCYWTPANNNWHEVGCRICWAAWRYGRIQDHTRRIFSGTEYISCSGNINNNQENAM